MDKDARTHKSQPKSCISWLSVVSQTSVSLSYGAGTPKCEVPVSRTPLQVPSVHTSSLRSCENFDALTEPWSDWRPKTAKTHFTVDANGTDPYLPVTQVLAACHFHLLKVFCIILAFRWKNDGPAMILSVSWPVQHRPSTARRRPTFAVATSPPWRLETRR